MRRYARLVAGLLLVWNVIDILSRVEYISKKLLWLWRLTTVDVQMAGNIVIAVGAAGWLFYDRFAPGEVAAIATLSRHEEEQLRLVSEKMSVMAPEEAAVIEALVRHGELDHREISILGLPSHICTSAIAKGTMTLLVKESIFMDSAQLRRPVFINPVFEPALRRYFERPRQ